MADHPSSVAEIVMVGLARISIIRMTYAHEGQHSMKNHTKAKLLQGQPAYGYGLGSGSARVTEFLARCGIDFLLIDNQHGSWGPDSTIDALAAASAGTATPMVRVARNDYTMIGRLLDEGAMGIVVPMVETVEEARAAAGACRFPPVGSRSWGWGRAATYGPDYADWINDELFVAVQLESVQAIEHAEAIMAVPGIDGCWVGPSDLALSLGIHPRDMGSSQEHRQALEHVVQACKNTGKVPGLACFSPDDALRHSELGFRFLTAGADLGFLMQGAMAGLKTLGFPS